MITHQTILTRCDYKERRSKKVSAAIVSISVIMSVVCTIPNMVLCLFFKYDTHTLRFACLETYRKERNLKSRIHNNNNNNTNFK